MTGASGFIGQELVSALMRRGYSVRGVCRSCWRHHDVGGDDVVYVNDIKDCSRHPEIFQGVDCVVHLAARVHVFNDPCDNPLSEFRTVNTESTIELARQAILAGVDRLVFMSSIKVNGERTCAEGRYEIGDKPCPSDAYAQSKYEAEKGLMELSSSTGLELVVVRPPLVYGPGVKANFARLMRAVKGGVPLPLGAVDNKRSMIGVDNLVDVIIRCVESRQAAGRTFLVSDGQDLSTAELVRMIARAMDRPARLIPVPVSVLRLAGAVVGRAAEVERLCGSLRVDSAETQQVLDWRPPVSVEAGVQATVDAFLRDR